MRSNRQYELAQIRENEYMVADMVRRGESRGRNRLIARVTRRLHRRTQSAEG